MFSNFFANTKERVNSLRCYCQDERCVYIVILLILSVYVSFLDLKGVWTDEGLRIGIINGWDEGLSRSMEGTFGVSDTFENVSHYSYQPAYYVLQHYIALWFGPTNIVLFKFINVLFMGVALLGILMLCKGWPAYQKIFLISVFSLHGYMFMHVLQVREYALGIAFIVWTTWLALFLRGIDLRQRSLAALPWFLGYGLIQALAFYTQLWIVFPAAAQFLFFLGRKENRIRFFSFLGLGYLLLLGAAIPYLLSHQNKVDVGSWSPDRTHLWSDLYQGFHLVLSGQWAEQTLMGNFQTLMGNFLFWFWLAMVAVAGVLRFVPRWRVAKGGVDASAKDQMTLMVLSIVVIFVFQILYFFIVDGLSIWPRYFFVYSLFVMFIVALSFNYLCALAGNPAVLRARRVLLRRGVVTVIVMAALSGVFQTWSYYRYPYLDTGMSNVCNWREVSKAMSGVVGKNDIIAVHDFLAAWAIYSNNKINNKFISEKQINAMAISSGSVVAYLYLYLEQPESSVADVSAKFAALGFKPNRVVELDTPKPNNCGHQQIYFFKHDETRTGGGSY